MKFNKKGQLGLDTVKAVMIAFLVLAVVGVTLALLLVNLRDVQESIIDAESESFANTTITASNVTGTQLSAYAKRLCAVTVIVVQNGTQVVPSSNYTTDACLFKIVGGHYADKSLNLTYTNSWKAGYSAEITGNVTAGTTEFFTNTSTIFSILVVVVIILAIAIIIGVVSRFGGGAGDIGGGRSGGSKGSGAGTVMGV